MLSWHLLSNSFISQMASIDCSISHRTLWDRRGHHFNFRLINELNFLSFALCWIQLTHVFRFFGRLVSAIFLCFWFCFHCVVFNLFDRITFLLNSILKHGNWFELSVFEKLFWISIILSADSDFFHYLVTVNVFLLSWLISWYVEHV